MLTGKHAWGAQLPACLAAFVHRWPAMNSAPVAEEMREFGLADINARNINESGFVNTEIEQERRRGNKSSTASNYGIRDMPAREALLGRCAAVGRGDTAGAGSARS